jgi:uncharacterized protein (TIGR02996 family)
MSAEAFLADIREQPEDDTPRLVYADWLDDHGEPDRADFIRVQIDLARMDSDDERRPELERREQALSQQHGKAWSAPLRRYSRQFQRGFADQVTLPAETFLAHAEDVFRLTPAWHVKLRSVKPHVAALADWRPGQALRPREPCPITKGARRPPLSSQLQGRMAMSQRTVSPEELQESHDLAAGWGKIVARRLFGDAGPGLGIDFQTLEQVAAAAAGGLTEGTLASLLEQQAQGLASAQPCPEGGRLCPVGHDERPPGRQRRPTHPERAALSLSRLSPGLFPPCGPRCAWTTTTTARPSCR